jgi:hypothetical protein
MIQKINTRKVASHMDFTRTTLGIVVMSVVNISHRIHEYMG